MLIWPTGNLGVEWGSINIQMCHFEYCLPMSILINNNYSASSFDPLAILEFYQVQPIYKCATLNVELSVTILINNNV